MSTAFAARTALTVVASNANGSGTFIVNLPDNAEDGFVWRLTQPVMINDDVTGLPIGELSSASASVSFDEVAGRGGMSPEVNLGFAVQAGGLDTGFMITSALVPVGPFNPASGRASAAYTITDLTGDGARLTGNGPTGGGYLAQYNGFVPVGSTFTEGINSIIAAGSNSASLSTPVGPGFLPIPGTVTDMSAMIVFTLSAGDFASGTSNYQIVPEPATMSLLALSAFALVRRR